MLNSAANEAFKQQNCLSFQFCCIALPEKISRRLSAREPPQKRTASARLARGLAPRDKPTKENTTKIYQAHMRVCLENTLSSVRVLFYSPIHLHLRSHLNAEFANMVAAGSTAG